MSAPEHRLPWLLAAAVLTTAGAGCGGEPGDGLTGRVEIDGSSTVYPVQEALAEEFQRGNRGVRVTVGISGSGGGFSRFCSGETDLSNASRHIDATERELCEANGIRFVEIPLAWDGLTVVVHPENDFAQCLTVEELRRIWRPRDPARTWRDVRPEFPDRPLRLYAPGTDSGTFDYFTEVIVGESGDSRPDFQASEDDNVLVQGVAGDRDALGYFGFAYYAENRGRLKALEIDGGDGCVAPSEETVEDGSYAPLSRPLFLYVKTASLARPEVRAYLEFAMEHAPEVIPPTGYLPLDRERYRENLDLIAEAAASEGR